MTDKINASAEADILGLTLLYDFYSELLTIKQREMFEMHYLNDFSLQEIADNFGISRQAVSDIIRRVRATLGDYEARLSLIETHNRVRSGLVEIAEGLEGLSGISPEIQVLHGKLTEIIRFL